MGARNLGAECRDGLAGVVLCCLGVCRVVGAAARAIFVGAVVLLPAVVFLLLDEAGLSRRSVLYRREYLTLVSLDIALSQHFFLLVGYAVPGVAVALLAARLDGASLLPYLGAWVTLGTPRDASFVALVAAVALGTYGMLGIALVASLVVTTYDEVMDDFPQAKAEVEAAIAERVQKSVDEIDYESRSRELVDYFVERLVLEAVQEKLDSGHLSNPTFAPLWFRLRTREPVLRRLFDGIPLDEERETA